MKKSYIKIIVATLLFALNPVLFKLVDLGPIEILWLGNLIAILALTISIIFQNRLKEFLLIRKRFIPLLLLGLVFTANNILFISAIKATSVANSMFTHYLMPVFVFIFGIFLVKEKVTKKAIISLVTALAGLGFILLPNEFSFTNSNFIGILLGAGSAVFFAFEVLLKKISIKKQKADIIVIFYLFISVLLLSSFVSYNSIASLDQAGLMIMIFSGLVANAVGVTLFTGALKDVKAQHASVISYIEPLGAVIFGLIVISEFPNLETIFGGALILIGAYAIIKINKN